MSPAGLQLGAPGVYPAPRIAEPAFEPVRQDVAGFVGVALRGPVNEAVLVRSWTDYQRRFGGVESPQGVPGPDRLLPYAVRAFFAQGGARAYVVRVAPPYDGPEPDPAQVLATARFRLGEIDLRAADEGTWADRLSVRLEFDVVATFTTQVAIEGELPVPAGVEIPPGSLLRMRRRGLPAEGVLHWSSEVALRVDERGRARRVAVIDSAVEPRDDPVDVAVVTAALVVVDPDKAFARSERVAGLGLHPAHPRFLWTVLGRESVLVAPDGVRAEPFLPADPLLTPVLGEQVQPGVDRWDRITHRSFFDDEPADFDPLDDRLSRGVDAIARVSEVALVCVPDLTWSWRGTGVLVEEPDRPRPTGRFGACHVESLAVSYAVPAPPAHLDGRYELNQVIARQVRLVEVAERRRRFVVLLDVPKGAPADAIARWRTRFDSSYAAAYYPWLGVPRVPGPGRVDVPPSGSAAGIIAARERRLGLPWGPANELALEAVTSADVVTDALHDRLHLLGINVYRAERDGFRLTAARTLSSDPQYRQLSVRRLMTMLALTLYRQSQWIVFESNTRALREQLVHALTMLLRGLQRQGAFAGATDEESFFVRCDDELNPASMQALGRLVALVGVAPAEPLEYLVLRITQDAEGQVEVVSERV